MRCLFVDRLRPSSIWTLVASLSRGLLARGAEVWWAAWDDGVADPSALPAPPGVRTRLLPVPPRLRSRDLLHQHAVFARAWHELLRALRPQLVHTHFCVPGAWARLAARASGAAVVATRHELAGSLRWPLYAAEVASAGAVDALVAVSRVVADSYPRRHATRVIPNGIALEAPLRRPGPTLVSPGRLARVKGQHRLLRALPGVLRRHPELRVRLLGEGPARPGLETLRARLGLERVELPGAVPRPALLAALAEARAVIVPSDGSQEGFGLVVAEAMACGAPLVVSDIPVFRELLGNQEERALFFDPLCPGSLRRALLRLLAAPEAAARRAARARQRAEARFGEETMVEAYLALYDEVLGRRR